METINDKLADIYFTRRQLAYLEKIFPEQLPSGKDTNELLIRGGARSVIHHIKGRTQ